MLAVSVRTGSNALRGSFTTLPQTIRLADDVVDESTVVKLLLEPGDIAIFDGFTPHRSAPNLSTSWRRQLYLSYSAQSDGGDQRDDHYEQFRKYLKKQYAAHDLVNVYFR